MSETLIHPQERNWAKVHIVCVFLLYFFLMAWPINIYLWNQVWETYYVAAVPVLAGFALYFRRSKDVVELRLLVAFWLWYILSRALNGGQALFDDFNGIVNFTLYFSFALVGFLLSGQGRIRFMKLFGALLTLYFSVVALISIYTAIYHVRLINPITEAVLCSFTGYGFTRLNLFDLNPNTSGMWFFIGFAPTPFLFYSCKRKLWRIPIALGGFLCYVGLALTYSRNTMAAFSGCVGILAAMELLRWLRFRKVWKKVAAAVLTAALVLAAVYMSFSFITGVMGRISSWALTVQEQETWSPPSASTSPEEQAEPSPSVDASVYFDDTRAVNINMSGRLSIFKTAFLTVLAEPERLLKGCPAADVMSVSNELLKPRSYPTMHNSFLEAMVLTGLPGLAIVLLFTGLLAFHMIRLFFSEDPRVSPAVKSLTGPLAGIVSYSMLEAQIFFNAEFTSLYFYLTAGILLAYAYELCPPSGRLFRWGRKSE